jgi:hypothetical protein
MFKALKEKLFSARKKLEHTLEEAPSEQVQTIPDSGGPDDSPAPKPADIPADQQKKAAPRLTDRIVSFVRDREFIISEKDVSDILDELRWAFGK